MNGRYICSFCKEINRDFHTSADEVGVALMSAHLAHEHDVRSGILSEVLSGGFNG